MSREISRRVQQCGQAGHPAPGKARKRESGVPEGRGGRRIAALLAFAAAGSGIALSPTVSHSAQADEAKPKSGECDSGAFCLWEGSGFRGGKHLYELKDVGIESCVPLPEGITARSFGNRTGRPVTVYQSRECAETAEFSTHPSGSWTPEGEYQVRAVKFWEN